MTGILLRYFYPSMNTKDHKDRNAIWYAVARCDEDLVRLLLEKKSDIWMMDYKQITPLNLAIAKQNLTITGMLLHHSKLNPLQPRLVDIDARDHPLCVAAGAGLKEIVQLLVTYGADLNVRNNQSQSLLH